MRKRTELIVALDMDSLDDALSLVDSAGDAVEWYKVGSQLFCNFGPEAVAKLKERGKKVFLDLKFHDIPNTVAKAVGTAVRMGVDMVNVHASGGRAMMEAAIKTAAENAVSEDLPIIIAVTVLTSMDETALKECLNRNDSYTPSMHVPHLAKLAQDSGMHGVVCSAHEIDINRKTCGDNFVLIVPGIRPAGSSTDDQKRIMTPAQAAEKGADYIVVGRPITKADNPSEAAKAINEELTLGTSRPI